MHQKYATDSPVVISSLYNFTSLSIATTSLSISLVDDRAKKLVELKLS